MQAYPHEFLQPLPPWYTSNIYHIVLNAGGPNSETVPEDEKEKQKDDKETSATNLAGDADAERNAENGEAIDKLSHFLQKLNKAQAKPELLFSLATVNKPV